MKNLLRVFIFLAVLMAVLIDGYAFPSTSYAQLLANHPLHTTMQMDATRLLTSTSSTSSLVVEYKVGASSVPGLQINPNIKILNNGNSNIPLSQLTLRYWFTRDSSSHMQAYCDSAQMGCTNVVARAHNLNLRPVAIEADSYIEVGFRSGVLSAHSDTGDIFLHAQDNTSTSPAIQKNDFSYNANLNEKNTCRQKDS